jgi:hypothetical protein
MMATTMTTTRCYNTVLSKLLLPLLQLLLFTFLLLLLNVSDYVYVVDASIEVIDTGKSYESRPDKYVGLQMRTGIEYSARLQRIPGDQHLCGDNQVNLLTVPNDGLPGT